MRNSPQNVIATKGKTVTDLTSALDKEVTRCSNYELSRSKIILFYNPNVSTIRMTKSFFSHIDFNLSHKGKQSPVNFVIEEYLYKSSSNHNVILYVYGWTTDPVTFLGLASHYVA